MPKPEDQMLNNEKKLTATDSKTEKPKFISEQNQKNWPKPNSLKSEEPKIPTPPSFS